MRLTHSIDSPLTSSNWRERPENNEHDADKVDCMDIKWCEYSATLILGVSEIDPNDTLHERHVQNSYSQ